MPDAGITPPYLDPSQYPDYLDAQRKQMVAGMLMNSLQQGSPTPPDWDSMKVVPKRGLMQNIAPLVTALMANKAMGSSQQAQQKYYSGLYGGGSQPQSAGSTPPSASPDGSGPPTGGSGTPPINQPQQPQQGGRNPMLLTGEPRTSQMLLSLMGQQEYGKALAGQYAPTDMQKMLRAAGIDPGSPQGQAALQQAASKANYIAPVDVRPGGTLVDPRTQQPTFTAPANGVQTQWGPNGPVASAVPGAQELAARQTALDTAAKVGNTPMTLPTQGGGSTVGYPGSLIGAPPAAGGQPPGQPPRPPGVMPPQAPNVPRQQPPAMPGTTVQPSASVPAGGAPQSPWNTMPKLQISNAIGAPNAFVEGRLKAAGSKDAELSSQYGKEADLADQKLQFNKEALQSLPNAETGPVSDWLTEKRSWLKEMGVPDSLVPGTGAIAPTIELNKYLGNSALQGARSTYGARMTQNEVALQMDELSPSAKMTKDAISSLVGQDNIKQQYAKQRADDYGKYVQQGGDPLRFESWYSKAFPLTQFAQQHAQTVPGQAAASMKAPAFQEGQIYKDKNGNRAKWMNGQWQPQ
jgi:hypothetical protein